MHSFIVALVIAFLLPLVAGGCALPMPVRDQPQPSAVVPVWPSPPAVPLIAYLRSVAEPKDWGIERSLFRRAIDALVGQTGDAFVRPIGVAERDGVLYVADPGAQALWVLDATKNNAAKVERVGEMKLLSPVAVAVRPDGAVFVADSALKKVFLVGRTGELLDIAADNDLARPAGIAYDPETRRLYVADAAAHVIYVYDPGGILIAKWGRRGTGDGEFNFPTHLALDEAGTLLVTDSLNFRIQVFDRDGRFLRKFGHPGDGAGDFSAPKGVAADRGGHLFVVDALFDAVQIFDHDGALLLAFGERGSKAGEFWLPGGIFVTAQGEIYVADAYNKRVQVFQAFSVPGGKTEK